MQPRFTMIILLAICFWTKAIAQKTPPMESMVYIESLDKDDKRLHFGAGVILKNNLVATNYHYVAGARKVRIRQYGKDTENFSEGYIGVDESKDLIVLYVNGLSGTPVKITNTLPGQGDKGVRIVEKPSTQNMVFKEVNFSRKYPLNDEELTELTSRNIEECLGGPVFWEDYLAGFTVAGYFHREYFTYFIPATQLKTLMGISTIIKSFNSLEETRYMAGSRFQTALMESLTSVLWLDFEDAVREAKKKKKKILIDVYTDWCGWCKLMFKNTYSNRDMIRYINENYVAVRINAEAREKIKFNGREFIYDPDLRCNQLAYSLLEGNMSYPSTVFLDHEINLLTVVPGYIEMDKLAVILRYFNENIYLDHSKTFEEYEQANLSSGLR
ncbi:MAG: DUF255 domain-containing protein [Bacteroidia bacterium]|nr:DUF255 domain-containing protein [Bacteroidia bacterium]